MIEWSVLRSRTAWLGGWMARAGLVCALSACGGGEPTTPTALTAGAGDRMIHLEPPGAGPARVPTSDAAAPAGGSQEALAAAKAGAPAASQARAPALPGKLLEGPPGLSAVSAFTEFTQPEVAGQRATARFAVTVKPEATVSQVNGLLAAVGGRIISMRAGDMMLMFEVPDSAVTDVRAQVLSRIETANAFDSALPLN